MQQKPDVPVLNDNGTVTKPMMDYSYDVAISFAGEDRKFAEAVATGLRKAGVNVFYDDFYASDLWGEDLSVSLRKVYHEASRFCIMVISAPYVEKMWTNFERQQAIERLIKQKGQSYILPVRLKEMKNEQQRRRKFLKTLIRNFVAIWPMSFSPRSRKTPPSSLNIWWSNFWSKWVMVVPLRTLDNPWVEAVTKE